MLAKPDPETFQILPWKEVDFPVPASSATSQDWMALPLRATRAMSYAAHLSKTRSKGFSFFAAPEMEYFYFADGDPSKPLELLDPGSYFDLEISGKAPKFVSALCWPWKTWASRLNTASTKTPRANTKSTLRYTDAMTMADTIMTVRLVVKELANPNGVHATFMPKPLTGVQGSGMHTHFSLFEGNTNAFSDPDDEHGLSKTAKSFIAGVLAHSRR